MKLLRLKNLKICFLAGLLFIGGCERDASTDVEDIEITFANLLPLWWNAQAMLVELEDIPGLKVSTVEVHTGKESKNIVLNGGADVGIVAASPLVWSAQNGERGFKVIARYMAGPKLVGIFSKSNENAGLNPPVAVVEGTVSEFVMYAHAQRNGISINSETFTLLNSRPPDVKNNLKTGSANSAVIWEPFAQSIEQDSSLNLKYSEFPQSLYSMKFFLIANSKSIEKKPEAIAKVKKEFERISSQLVRDQGDLKNKIEQLSGYDLGALTGRWDEVDFSFITDKQIIKSDLLEEADIIVRAEKISKAPSFDHFF